MSGENLLFESKDTWHSIKACQNKRLHLLLTCVAQKRLYLSSLKFGWQFSQLLYRSVYQQQSIKKTASGLMFNFKSILLPELLRILFWTCIGALAVSLLALIIAGVFLRHSQYTDHKNKNSFFTVCYICVGGCLCWFIVCQSVPKKLLKILCAYINIYQGQES